MLKEYELTAEDERIIDELDNFCGVVQNKEVLKDMIVFSKLKKRGEVDFGNFNIIVRNDSAYLLLNDLLKVVGKLLLRHNIIPQPTPQVNDGGERRLFYNLARFSFNIFRFLFIKLSNSRRTIAA